MTRTEAITEVTAEIIANDPSYHTETRDDGLVKHVILNKTKQLVEFTGITDLEERRLTALCVIDRYLKRRSLHE